MAYMKNHPIFGKYNGSILRQGTQSYQDIKPFSKFEMLCSDCNHENPVCGGHYDLTNKNIPDKLISYDLNNYGLRCDDFSKELSGNNFLFSGCSHTSGVGIPYELTWAYQLNKMFNKENFFNVAIGANNIQMSISNVFEYIKEFGNPSGIFILLPDYSRSTMFRYDTNYFEEFEEGTYIRTMGHFPLTIDYYRLNLYTQITSLELYCNNLQIPLIWGSWDNETSEDINKFSDLFSNYLDMGPTNVDFNIIGNAPKELKKNKYWHKSRDLIHFGGGIHYWMANRFKQEWDKKYA
jgi:hypothetical protein